MRIKRIALDYIQKRSPKHRTPNHSVGLPGFEPGKTGPESVVLPLHHSPNL